MIKKIFTYTLMIVILGGALGALGLVSAFYYLDEELPDHRHLANYDPPLVTRLYAANGQLLQEYAHQHRSFVPINFVPRDVIQAFLAAEDRNFYSHHGLDYMGILRAAGRNFVAGHDKRLHGASSITQQVAKNFLLTNEVSIKRKLKEAIVAWKLENTFSKDKILELYLNEIYLGSGAYGVAAAALKYFNKSLQELSLGESAYIAGLPKSPNPYSLWHNPERALERRNFVLSRMMENGWITQEAYHAALDEPLTPKAYQEETTVRAPYFSEDVRQQVLGTYGPDALYKGGLVVRTTLDPQLQRYAEEALRSGLIQYDRKYGWRGALGTISLVRWQESLKKFPPPPGLKSTPWRLAVVLDVTTKAAVIGFADGTADGTQGTLPLDRLTWARPHLKTAKGLPTVGPAPSAVFQVLKPGQVIVVSKKTETTWGLEQTPQVEGALVAMDATTGRVMAMVGGFSFERSKYNRASQAYRQTGSAFKPFVYLSALEQGYTPASILVDEPVEIFLGPKLGFWRPNNITKQFYGPVTLRTALEKSLNVSTVRLAQDVGLGKIAEVSARLGVNPSLLAQWSVALGAAETTLLKMTTGFAQFANGGKEVTPIFIDRIQDRRGVTLYRQTSQDCVGCNGPRVSPDVLPTLEDKRRQIIDPRHAYQMNVLLQGVVEHGTGKSAGIPGYTLAGKTGSTNNFRDSWFVGYSHHLVVGVYIGFDAPKSLGEKQTGGALAAPIFKDFMVKALAKTGSAPFKTPKGLMFKPINRLTGEPTTLSDPTMISEPFLIEAPHEPSFDERPVTLTDAPVDPQSFQAPPEGGPDMRAEGFDDAARGGEDADEVFPTQLEDADRTSTAQSSEVAALSKVPVPILPPLSKPDVTPNIPLALPESEPAPPLAAPPLAEEATPEIKDPWV